MKLLLYCTKAKPYLADFKGEYQTYSNGKELDELWDKGFNLNDIMNILNGKIVAECDFEVEWCDTSWCCGDFIEHKGLEKSCLTKEQLFDYVKGRNEFYAIHINNLYIFDEPKKITAYHCKTNKNDELCLNGGCGYKFFHKAPQNMMKVYDHWGKGNEYILISIRPEWLCKILNGEKTIEVRKKVLKEMI